ncbi:hypothetical protein SBE55_14135 [Mycolicibacterium sp. 141076]|uniref:hypothetical protein n=1 Tax=Mycolicibacterium sp. 141076 TaxID=3090599 RepID=UPI00299E3700|nr:hypothetical protein [Mycolicibacterium sp. 141076]MDX1878954.1 hypothetical protein [Mycolicibacterium sp. 141076]
MTDGEDVVVPLWLLATQETTLPEIPAAGGLTPERLSELRSALTLLADTPIATLEQHPMPEGVDRTGAVALHSASPLAHHLSQLVSHTSKAVPKTGASGETLYRMVVPAKVAAQMGNGLARPMASKAASGGIHGAIVGSKGITAQATFVPAAGGAGAAVAGASALTLAAPLVLMAVAVGVSAHSEHRRQQAIEHITELLEHLVEGKLNEERDALNGCRAAIDKATAIVLDKGEIGQTIGIGPADHTIDIAIATAERRLKNWQRAVDAIDSNTAEMSYLTKTFVGIDKTGGEFRTHLELADLAIALKRRVIILQAVEQGRKDATNPFGRFVQSLKADQQRVDELEAGIHSVLCKLGELQLKRPGGFTNTLFSKGEVDDLLKAAYRLRELGERAQFPDNKTDMVIDIAREADGSVVVFPAISA